MAKLFERITTVISKRGTWASRFKGEDIGILAAHCLSLEVQTCPKPGLVSHVDKDVHNHMDGALLARSDHTLAPFFASMAAAGASGAGMGRLQTIGIAAERAMLSATGGVNTHRGAIFGLGLLCAAQGVREASGIDRSLGQIVAVRWARGILAGPIILHSHGTYAARRYGAGGARVQAAQGFPAVYAIGLPALRAGRLLAAGDEEAARVHAFMALMAVVEDTNLLHRAGLNGLSFARSQASAFLAHGGAGQSDWRAQAIAIHRALADRNLWPGGSATLLAMTLFVDRSEP